MKKLFVLFITIVLLLTNSFNCFAIQDCKSIENIITLENDGASFEGDDLPSPDEDMFKTDEDYSFIKNEDPEKDKSNVEKENSLIVPLAIGIGITGFAIVGLILFFLRKKKK